jgi:opacity protein-like surface antigen
MATGLSAAAFGAVHEQDLWLGVNVGGVHEVGPNFDRQQWGLSVAADGLVHLNQYVLVGGRIGFNSWDPDKDEFTDAAAELIDADVSGETTVFELAPLLRFRTAFANVPFDMFAQGGAGLFVIDNKIELSGPDSTDNIREVVFGQGKENRFGLQFGGGITISLTSFMELEAYPLWNLVWLDDSRHFKYMSINGALRVGLF